MQLKHLQSITRPGDGIVKVTAVCWAPNGKRLAICTTDRVVQMFDEDGVPKDKFFTKPADKVSSQTIFRIFPSCHFTYIKIYLQLSHCTGSQKLHREANGVFS
jgi:hypothetical protein